MTRTPINRNYNVTSLGSDFRFGGGIAGKRGLQRKLSSLRSNTRPGVYSLKNLSKENVKTFESLLKPYKRSLKGINRMSSRQSTPGLTRKEAVILKRKAWSLYKQDRYSDKSKTDKLSKQDLQDFKDIVKQLSRDEQKKIKEQNKSKIVYRRPYLEEEQSTGHNISALNLGKSYSQARATGVAHGLHSINQMIQGSRNNELGNKLGKSRPPKPPSSNFGLKV